MRNSFNLTGNMFGRLTVVGRAYLDKHKQVHWECLCLCGSKTYPCSAHLLSGHTKSCGCLQKEIVTTHGRSRERLYKTWKNMLDRCNNPKHEAYIRYGGKGICVCKEWKDYECFRAWATSNGYKDELTIDRIDSTGHYSPENCQFITKAENTRRSSARLTETNKNEIIRMIRLGIKQKTIAQAYNVSDALISKIKSGFNQVMFPLKQS